MERKSSFIVLLLLLFHTAFGQIDTRAISDSIVKEASILYDLEYASWYGTDIFLEVFKGDKDKIAGYFSYSDKNEHICIFYDNSDLHKVLGSIHFVTKENVYYDSTYRRMTDLEEDYYQLRRLANFEISTDTLLFRSYKGTTLNLIPIIDKNRRVVYVITGTNQTGVVYLGNDYLLTFNEKNELLSKRKLHQSLIPIKYADPNSKDDVGAVHTHLPETGMFMTATDICTIRLYQNLGKWRQQMVISEQYMSIWNCDANSLIIVPTK